MDMETGKVPTHSLADVRRDISSARGLPNAHYVDPAVYEIEKQKLFFETWASVGFASDVPEAGDAVPVDYLGMPLLLLRDREDQVRVYQNVCRHRGMTLISEPGKIRGVIRCPYHSWCYGLDGQLVSTPHVGGPGQNLHEGIDRSQLGLIEVRSHVYRDVIHVNVSGDAPPFETHAAEVIERLREFDQPDYRPADDSAFTLDVQCNWKLAIENFCESYHLPWIHPGLNSYSRLEDHYHIIEEGKFAGQGTTVYAPRLGDGSLAFENFPGLSDKWNTGAEYIALFPNTLYAVQRDHVYMVLMVPAGPDRTFERMMIRYADPDALGERFAELRRENEAQWREIFEEDIGVVEGMQKGRSAPGFDGGKFSPVMDNPTHAFHVWVAERFAS